MLNEILYHTIPVWLLLLSLVSFWFGWNSRAIWKGMKKWYKSMSKCTLYNEQKYVLPSGMIVTDMKLHILNEDGTITTTPIDPVKEKGPTDLPNRKMNDGWAPGGLKNDK